MKKFFVWMIAVAAVCVVQGEELFEKYANDMEAFAHFRRYATTKPVPDFKSEACPEKFNLINLALDSFAGKKWSIKKDKLGVYLMLQYGHNNFAASSEFTVNTPGVYRVWVNYWHPQKYVGSFGVNIYDADGKKVLTHKMDYVPYRNTGMQELKNRKSAWYWESAPMVELLPGKYRFEVTGLIHQGPYTWRRIRHIILTDDPFAEGNMEMVGKKELPAADLTKQCWDAWHKRPGAVPASALSEAQKLYYRAWLRAYLIEKSK